MLIRKIKEIDSTEIIDTLRNGGLVIMPTETLYGAFVDATNPVAVKKLTLFKNRPFGKPYSMAVNNQEMAERYVTLNSTAQDLYRTFLPGPVTVISKGKHTVAPGIESESGTLGIRIPDYKLVLDVIKKFNRPITATSANASYKKRPYSLKDILTNLSGKQKKLIDLIVDAGKLPRREPSTVIDTTIDDPVVLRQGDVTITGKTEIVSRSPENTQNFAKELWQKYGIYTNKRAIVFALVGSMGTGKTVFTKGLARAMGVKDKVISPTYNLEEDYDHGKLLHVDCWRMESDTELTDLDFGKKITDKSVVALEWADKAADVIRKYNEEAVIIWIKIDYGKKENERIISWQTH